jgi:hypothetical protein
MLLDGTRSEIVERDDGFIDTSMLNYFLPVPAGHPWNAAHFASFEAGCSTSASAPDEWRSSCSGAAAMWSGSISLLALSKWHGSAASATFV